MNEALAISLQRQNNLWVGQFSAMASPCELLLDTTDETLAYQLVAIAEREAKRIEQKFSRYRDDNIIFKINNALGQSIEVDAETALLLDYADQCYQLSNGQFDITSGVLREVWRFDGGDRVPSTSAIKSVLSRVGWSKVNWESSILTMDEGMEIDLGGIGKEYAVDRAALLIKPYLQSGVLINFGGDLCALGPRLNGQPWEVAIEDSGKGEKSQAALVSLSSGSVATSGDARRFLIKDGVRYGHILNPVTGWPVPDAPRSVTTVASTCMEAGMLATFAILRGAGAKAFLQQQEVEFLCL